MLVVGVAGGSGSGKTTVVRKIMNQVPTGKVGVMQQDSYYFDNSHINSDERDKLNYDHPSAIEFSLMASHIDLLRSGNKVPVPTYSFLTSTRLNEIKVLEPVDVLIVEGILVFCDEFLRSKMDVKVFVDAPSDDRLIRIIKRDMEERGRNAREVISRYLETVKPMHDQFIEPSKKYADIIIPGGAENLIAIDLLSKVIATRIKPEL
jgi:uridine kinase